MNDTPNVDVMDRAELVVFMESAISLQLRRYAYLKLYAMDMRERGFTVTARHTERAMDAIYEHLAPGEKW